MDVKSTERGVTEKWGFAGSNDFRWAHCEILPVALGGHGHRGFKRNLKCISQSVQGTVADLFYHSVQVLQASFRSNRSSMLPTGASVARSHEVLPPWRTTGDINSSNPRISLAFARSTPAKRAADNDHFSCCLFPVI